MPYRSNHPREGHRLRVRHRRCARTWLRNGQQVRAASGGEPVRQLANRQLLREYTKATGGGVFRIYTVEEILRLASNQYGVTVSDATYNAIRAEQPVAV